MSDETFFTDPGFGEFIVSANGHYDHQAGIWFKPWTNKPARADIGYVMVRHPDDEVIGYTYLIVDVEAGRITWYHGPSGDPATDDVLSVTEYR